MNDLMVFVYFLCFAAVAGATFAYMYAMMNATLLDYNRSREKQNVHPEMSDVKSGEEKTTEDPIVLIHTTHNDGC